MKILLSHRYFWPDTPPYATMLRSIAVKLVSEGHDVTVYTTKPSYHASGDKEAPSFESLDGFSIVRAPIFTEQKKNIGLRLINLIRYSMGLRRYILKNPDIDIVMASTFPPIAAGFFAAQAAKKIKARFIYHCMDLHPEVSHYSGHLKRGFIFKGLQYLDNMTCHRADDVVVLSGDMAQTIEQRDPKRTLGPKIINNFILEDFNKAIASDDSLHLPQDKFTILFAGNIGNFQNLDFVIEAAHKVKHLEDIQFWFMGEGAAKKRLIEKAGALLDKTVFFLPFSLSSVAQRMMKEADLNLVSLNPDIYKVAYPSKTLSILGQSGLILAVIEPESELAQMVLENKIGYNAPPENSEGLADVIQTAWQEREHHAILRENSQKVYQKYYATDDILEQWSVLMNKKNH